MIITCPSCATSYNLPDDDFATNGAISGGSISDGSIIKCTSCGHAWLEARAVEVIDSADIVDLIQDDVTVSHHDGHSDGHSDYHNGYSESGEYGTTPNLPAIPQAPDAEYEAARIAKAVKQAEQNRLADVARKRAKLRGWMTLAACITAPFALAAVFPETVVGVLPGAIVIYDKVGIDVNIPGFTIANVTHQYIMAGDTPVLAIRGDIINVSGREKIVPSLRFALRDKDRREVYNWTLNGVARRPLRPGLSTSFLTRVASPPKLADDFQIRFALEGEIAKTASYESNSDQRSQN